MEGNYYFTFGCNHRDIYGNSLMNCYVKLKGTVNSTREQMFNQRQSAWAFQYSEKEFQKQIEQFGLREVSLSQI